MYFFIFIFIFLFQLETIEYYILNFLHELT